MGSDQFMAFMEKSKGMRRRGFPRHIRDVPQMFKPELSETSGKAKSSQRRDKMWLCGARVCFAIPAGVLFLWGFKCPLPKTQDE